MYFHRAIEDALLCASEQFPALLLTGPRQAGKTTLLRHLCGNDRRYVTLDDMTLRELACNDPVLFLQQYHPPVLIDEIQYAPMLLPYIKMAIDEGSAKGTFWLTGSQHFNLMKGITESLAGRVAIVNLLGFSRREQEKRTGDLEPFLPTESAIVARQSNTGVCNLEKIYQQIWKGSFPALHANKQVDRTLFYSSYLQTYLQRDVNDLAQVGNQQSFMRFVKACAARTGKMLNLTELARDVDISVNTAKTWLSILMATFQVALLQPYHTNLTKRLIKMPKLYFLDTGFCSYLTEWTSPETLLAGAMSGAIFETYVYGEIIKSWWNRIRAPNLYYYRDKDGIEIDFLFEQDQTFYPIEVKRNATPQSQWANSFNVLNRLNKKVGTGAVVCMCKEQYPLTENVTALPVGLI